MGGVGAADRVVFLHSVSAELETNIKPIQSEFAGVVDILRDELKTLEAIGQLRQRQVARVRSCLGH